MGETIKPSPDILRGTALFPGESVTVELDCDTYDARLIDEDGVECFIDAIDLCFDDALWVIRNSSCSITCVIKRCCCFSIILNTCLMEQNYCQSY